MESESSEVRWSSFAALGDSFTDGLNDTRADGSFRGWADRVARQLAKRDPSWSYANLAIRSRKLQPILDEQVEQALALNKGVVVEIEIEELKSLCRKGQGRKREKRETHDG